ncbi:hypothetical protein RHGRI_027221 [Rhododendron griersonianum]|uniref:Glycolipid transfer protein domain-containing protein n=1 Tax=Rhododendron griersonianum TaxID=479676 RepID=A0AAV6J017_9ERIC|nr:hypothetical protein RHGRI_027221 [Rhododendron griersonianum]
MNFFSDQMAATNETVLTKIAEAFNELADDVNSRTTPPRLSLSKFCSACRLLSHLIGCLGIAFRFADIEFSAKVDALTTASKSIDTIEALIDLDIAHNTGKNSSSNSRNLIRTNRTVDLLRIMFEQILAQRGNSITGPGLTAYEQVFAPYHCLALKTAARAAVLTLPTKARVLRKLNENDPSRGFEQPLLSVQDLNESMRNVRNYMLETNREMSREISQYVGSAMTEIRDSNMHLAASMGSLTTNVNAMSSTVGDLVAMMKEERKGKGLIDLPP